jgi:phosphoadenosine phosphosulfate reductase
VTCLDLTTLSPRELAERAGDELEGAPPLEVLRWAVDRFSPRFAITASMQDTVLLHMISRIDREVPVVFLDTGYHFAETIGTADAAEMVYGLNSLLRIRPKLTVEQQDEAFGAKLYERDPDACCRMRKVRPLETAMREYDAWASGLRRDESDSRAAARLVEWDERKGKVKINPLVAWSQAQIDDYIAANGVLVNPLLSEGYGSVGCAPCTRPGSGRDGRWAGQSKIECGLHV